MKRLALVSLLIIATVFAIAVKSRPASGGISIEDNFEVDVNVESDPSNHAKEIEMPENMKLTVKTSGPEFQTLLFRITGPFPWVEVERFAPSFPGVVATGFGTVAGNQNVAVEFDGIFTTDELSGTYTMGVDVPGSELLPGGQPIVYRIKPKPPTATPTPTATLDLKAGPTATASPTLTPPSTATATASPPPTSPPTATMPLDVEQTIHYGCEATITIQDNSEISGGEEGITLDCEGDELSNGTVQFDFEPSDVIIDSDLPIVGEDESVVIGIEECSPTAFVTSPTLLQSIETACQAVIDVFSSFFGSGAGGGPDAVYVSEGPVTLRTTSTYPPFGATWDSGDVDIPLVNAASPEEVVGALVSLRVAFSSYGDVNCNMLTNAIDAVLALQLAAALLESLLCEHAGDVNLSGSVDPIDAALILQFIAGLLANLPVGVGPIVTTTPTMIPTPTLGTPTSTMTPSPTALSTPTVPSTATAPATATMATPTATDTPSASAKLTLKKETFTNLDVEIDDNASGWEVRIYSGHNCPPQADIVSTTPFNVFLSPGDYSVREVEQVGWERVFPLASCANITLTPGEDETFTFRNRMDP